MALEDDLKGQLYLHEKELFENHFLIFEYRQRKLRFLSSLLGVAAGLQAFPDAPQRVRVFLCATYEDLAEERKSILESLRKMKLEHDSMELFGARVDRPLETCLREVRQSDVVLVVVGFRYGTLVPHLGISFSEAEYREAIRLRKPCLVYLRDEATPLSPRLMERNPQKLALLEAFRASLLERHTVAIYKDAADLTVRFSLDLRHLIDTISKVPITGRARPNDAAPSSEILTLIEVARREGIPDTELVSILRRAFTSYLVATGRRSPTVYLCHAPSERELALSIKARLSGEGVSVWEPEQRSGDDSDFVREIAAGFDNAALAVVLLSRQLLQDAWARREVDLIVARRMSRARSAAVLPVLVGDDRLLQCSAT